MFPALKAHSRRLEEACIFSVIQVGRSSLFEGDADVLPTNFHCFSNIFMFIQLSFCVTCISLYVASLYWCKDMPKLWWLFRLYEMRQSLRLFAILNICMCNKCRRLCNVSIWRVYVYSIRLYYVYVEVYVNLPVDVMQSFKFSTFLTYECNDMTLRG